MLHRSLLTPNPGHHFGDITMGDTVSGAADYRGQPASRAATGGWKSSIFVMGAFQSLFVHADGGPSCC